MTHNPHDRSWNSYFDGPDDRRAFPEDPRKAADAERIREEEKNAQRPVTRRQLSEYEIETRAAAAADFADNWKWSESPKKDEDDPENGNWPQWGPLR